jgi:hypothetical protein
VETIVEIGPLGVERSLKDRWLTGALAGEWAQSFPQLFDGDDLRLAQGPQGGRGYHFIEWMAAIAMHERTGYLSLVNKYEFAVHRGKQAILEQLLSPDVRAALRDRAQHGRAQAPDLLMYAPDLSDWFFCEVKGPGDSLKAEQRKKFEALAEMTGRPVRLLWLKWAPLDAAAGGVLAPDQASGARACAVRRSPKSEMASEPSTYPLSVHGFDAVITLTPDPAENAVHWEVKLPAGGDGEAELICSSERVPFVNRGERQALRAARIHATKILRERLP